MNKLICDFCKKEIIETAKHTKVFFVDKLLGRFGEYDFHTECSAKVGNNMLEFCNKGGTEDTHA